MPSEQEADMTANQPKRAAPDIVIFVVPKTLSDGSQVFDVHLGNLVVAAVTQDDALSMADKIRDAIDDHSVVSVGVVCD
jgi:hypothetical protein